MTSATNPNANQVAETPLYDAVNHQVVAWEADESTVTVDSSVTPNITYAKAKISGTFSSTPPSDLSGTGTISAAQPVINTPVANATVVLALGTGQSTWKAQLANGGGGFTSGTTLVADKSIDGGTTWYSASFKVSGASPSTPQSSVTGPGPLELTGNAAGATHVRIRCSVLNSTETIAVRINASTGVSEVSVMAPLPAGTNTIGTVNTLHGSGIDATNSSTTPLASNGVFTGSSQSSLNYSALSIEVFADQASAANGLSIQQSTNGTNWDIQDTFNVAASTAFNTTINLVGSKYRIVYTNGATLQTVLRLQTITQTQDVVLPRTLTANGNLKIAIQEGANSNGQNTSANSAPVVLPSDQIYKEIAGLGASVTALNTDLLPWTDVGLYRWVDIHITGTYNATLTFQESGDGVNVGASALLTSLSAADFGSTTVTTSTSSTGLILSGPLNSRWFRIRATSFTSNSSLAATVHFYLFPPGLFTTVTKIAASPSGGSSTDYHLVSAASTNAANIKSSGGQVYGYEIYNTNAAVRYVKLFNKATAPVPGTDTPYRTIAVPPSGRASFSSAVGIQFLTGIGIATTTGIADLDSVAVGAADLVIDIDVR